MKVRLLLAVICLAAPVFGASALHAQATGTAQMLFESANGEREARNLPPLKWSSQLAAAARQHAARMAEQSTLSHQLPGEPDMVARATQAGARFSSLAENVAEGPNGETIHKQWMNSPPHRANLLDPQLDSVGVAVAENNGVLFAVEDFSLSGEKLSIDEQEAAVGARLRARGLRLVNYTGDARRSCILDNGYAGSHVPSFVLHYAAPELEHLPDLLEQRIKTGKYHSAVVGACPSDARAGFTNYRIAVLLFE